MCVIVDYTKYVENGFNWTPNTKLKKTQSCDCDGTGYHKFEPYETQSELLIKKLDELIKLIKEWNNG